MHRKYSEKVKESILSGKSTLGKIEKINKSIDIAVKNENSITAQAQVLTLFSIKLGAALDGLKAEKTKLLGVIEAELKAELGENPARLIDTIKCLKQDAAINKILGFHRDPGQDGQTESQKKFQKILAEYESKANESGRLIEMMSIAVRHGEQQDMISP